MALIVDRPLSWYVESLERADPFTALTYGDGEFLVAAGLRTGVKEFTSYREEVTPALVEELRESLRADGADIVRGTDLNIVNYTDYPGGDAAVVRQIGQALEQITDGIPVVWCDGVVWDRASRQGELGPLIRALRTRDVALVSNERLRAAADWLGYKAAATVPGENAAAHLDSIERQLADLSGPWAYVVCMGLGAIPLIMRLRRRNPWGTFLDLGSALDIFAKLGGDRSWRQILYQDQVAYAGLIQKHLDGIF